MFAQILLQKFSFFNSIVPLTLVGKDFFAFVFEFFNFAQQIPHIVRINKDCVLITGVNVDFVGQKVVQFKAQRFLVIQSTRTQSQKRRAELIQPLGNNINRLVHSGRNKNRFSVGNQVRNKVHDGLGFARSRRAINRNERILFDFFQNISLRIAQRKGRHREKVF